MIHLPGGAVAVSNELGSHPDLEALIRQNHELQLALAMDMGAIVAALERPGDCQVCGRPLPPLGQRHECPPATVAAIEAANTRAEFGTEPFADELRRPIPERLLHGLRILFEELEP